MYNWSIIEKSSKLNSKQQQEFTKPRFTNNSRNFTVSVHFLHLKHKIYINKPVKAM